MEEREYAVRRGTVIGVLRFAACVQVCRRLRRASYGRQACVMEGAMVLSFWMVMFMLLPLAGLAGFACLMNRPMGRHR